MADVSSKRPSIDPSSQSVCAVAYYDEWQVWQFLERYFRSCLPLRDATWRSPTGTGSTVTISALPLQVLEHDHAVFKGLDAVSRHRAPYAHINLVVCETLDRYKATIKDKVKAWIDERTEKQEEWLLVYVPIGTQNNTHDTYAKIYTKLMTDFYIKSAGDRSSMLTIFESGLTGPLAAAGSGGSSRDLAQQSSAQDQWADVMAKLKVAIITTAVSRFKQLDDEVKRLESTRLSPDWNFFSFFFAKESLGLIYEQLQLPGEALKQYEELSGYCDRWQKLMPALAPKSLMIFQPPGQQQQQQRRPGAVAVIEFPVYEFRARLEAKEVGILEVQQYLFSREASFLQQLGQHASVVRRSHAFIRQQYQTLNVMAPAVPSECAQLWAFTAACAVIQAAEDHLKAQKELGGGVSDAPPPPTVPPPKPAKSPHSSKVPASPAVVVLPDEERLIQMSRQLSELLDFCRLRFLDVATSLLGADVLWQQALVCAARRELAAGGVWSLQLQQEAHPQQPSGGRSDAGGGGGGAVSPGPVSLDDISVKVEATSTASSSSSSPQHSASLTPAGEGSSEASGSGDDDPRKVAVSLSGMLSRAPWVRETLASVRSFDEHYLKLTENLAKHLERAARDRCTGRVQAERAAVLLKMGEYEDARRILRSLAEGVYRKDSWSVILSQILSQLAICEKERGNSKTYVSALLQVLSLNSRDDRVSAYLPEIEDFVRHRMSVRLIKPLDLLVTARIKSSTGTVEVGGQASVRLWLSNNLKHPLTLDGATVLVGELTDLRRRRRIGAELGWLAATSGELESPISPRPSSRATTQPGATGYSTYDDEVNECLLWRLPGPIILPPGITELELHPPSLPPPGTYVFERLLLPWGNLALEQDQLTGLDTDTLDLITKQRQPPRRFSALSRLPAKRAVSLKVVPRHVAAAMSVVSYPIIPPDSDYRHHLSLVLDTALDSLHATEVIISHSPAALTFKPQALLAFYPYRPPPSTATAAQPHNTSPPKGPKQQLGGGVTAEVHVAPSGSQAAAGQAEEDEDDVQPLATNDVDVEWDGSTARLALPDLPPKTSIVMSLQLQPLPEIMQRFVVARQDQSLAIDIEVELSAEFNRDSFKPLIARPTTVIAMPPATPITPVSSPPRPLSSSTNLSVSTSGSKSPRRPGSTSLSRKVNIVTSSASSVTDAPSSSSATPSTPSAASSPHGHKSPRLQQQQPSSSLSKAVEEVSPALSREASLPVSPTPAEQPRRSSLQSTFRVVIQQPFTVTITVQDCPSPAATPRRYLVQAVLHSRAPIAMTLHECRLRIPKAYSIVHSANAHLHDLLLSPGQDVHYAYLIERATKPSSHPPTPTAPPEGKDEEEAGGGAGQLLRRNKMSVSANYSWENLTAVSGRVRRHHPPQQQNFERYFQDSAMAVRPVDHLRTFLVKADIRRNTEDATHTEGRIPAAATAVPSRDVDERGVVVGHFRNHVTDVYVGTSLRLEFSVELSEEAQKELDRQQHEEKGGEQEDEARQRRLRLAYEVMADAADWAVSGFAKGTLEMKKGEAAKVECQLVPIRIGMLACPSVTFRPIDVRHPMSPRSRKKHDVRWVGPHDIQVFPTQPTHSRYPVLKVPLVDS